MNKEIHRSTKLIPKLNPLRNDYKITCKSLGKGMNGKVYLCKNRKTGKRFALKVT